MVVWEMCAGVGSGVRGGGGCNGPATTEVLIGCEGPSKRVEEKMGVRLALGRTLAA